MGFPETSEAGFGGSEQALALPRFVRFGNRGEVCGNRFKRDVEAPSPTDCNFICGYRYYSPISLRVADDISACSDVKNLIKFCKIPPICDTNR